MFLTTLLPVDYIINLSMDVFSFNESSGSGYVEVDINAALDTVHSFNFTLRQGEPESVTFDSSRCLSTHSRYISG